MDSDARFILRVVVITLAAVMVSVILVLLVGLFDPLVDNKDIFAVLGPAFHTVVGVFVGILSSAFLRKSD